MISALDNSLQNLRVRLQSSQAGHFLRWWGRELRDMLPARLRAGMQHARRRLVIKLDGDELALSIHEAGEMHELEVVSLDEDPRLLRQRLSDLLSDRELAEVSRDLLLPEDRVLAKEVILPLAAEANLKQALAFEMDRQTPYRADDVFFDYLVTSRDKEHGQLRVQLLVTPRQPLLNEIERLEPLGMAPSGVDVLVDGEPRGINLLPLDLRRRVVNSRARLNLMLLSAAFLLLVLVMAQSLWLRQHQIAEVQQAIDEVRSEALQVQQIRKRIEDASEAAGFLNERRAASVPTVKVLNEVTRILPDDTYLDRLLIDTDSVQLQGKSQNAQQLIELVNESPMFRDAAFRGPTRLDSRTQKEMFDINTSLVPESE
ncbi:MAG: hypothetical protein HKO64_05095 [Xanthomonadales bacterium]|nr:PilN domain-containing protein [Gammaproteobacteria bacterium]NNE04126.1 hypothetical protein [Xanthomonadales bacterium]NNL94976.1 hypothetical protein [Xanthomonadales bacterium]